MDSKTEARRPPTGWQKFNLRVVRHPLLKRFRINQRWRIMQVLSLACDWGNLGVILQYDDEIAAELDMPLEDWLQLRDKLLLHDIMRHVERPNGRRAYEISYILLPEQEDDQRSPEAFQPATWQQPQLPLGIEGNTSQRILEMLPASLDDEQRKRLLNSERQAYFKAAARARNEGQPEPDRDTFRWDYFNQKFPDSVPDLAPESPVNGNAAAGDSGNAEGTVTGNANAPKTTRKDENEIDNTTPAAGNANAEKKVESVTGNAVGVVFSDFDSPLSPEESFDLLVEAVVGVLTSPGYDVTERVAREELIPQCGLSVCIEQLAYFRYAPERSNPGGHLANAIRGRFGVPPGYPKRKEQQKQERNRKRNEAKKAQRTDAAKEAQQQADARADAYYLAQGPEPQSEIGEAARKRFREKQGLLCQKWEASGGHPSDWLESAYLTHRRAICTERLGLEAGDG